MLWSDVDIAGVPVGLKRYLLALIVAVIAFQISFDWTTHHHAFFASLSTYKPIVDIICTALLGLTIMSLLGISVLGRSRVVQ